MPGRYFINRRYPPIAFVSQAGEVTDAEQIAHLNELLEHARADIARGVRWVVVVDSRFSTVGSATQRKQLSQFLNANGDLVRAASLAHVFIVDSMMVRGAITALRWLGALPREIISVADFAEAIAQARFALEGQGCPPIPESLVGPSGEELALGDLHAHARDVRMKKTGS